MGAKFTFLPLTWSIFDGFSKLFFLLKAGLHCQLLKKLMRNCLPSSASPVYSIGKNTNFLSLKCQFTLMSSTACETGILFIAASLRSCSTSSRCCCNAVFIWNIKSSLVSLFWLDTLWYWINVQHGYQFQEFFLSTNTLINFRKIFCLNNFDIAQC